MPDVRLFRFRPYRIAVRLDVDFYFGSEVLHGISRDISCDGIRVVLNGQVAAGNEGRIALRNATMCFELHAKVTYICRNETAFAFSFNSSGDRERLVSLISSFQKVSRFQTAKPKSPKP